MSQEVDGLKKSLKEIPKAMGIFSLSMRSLYAGNAVGSNEKAAKEFRKLRDDTRNDAMVYLEGILPLSTKFVASISEYFEYYEALDYEEWKKYLKDILEEVVGYRQLCETLLKMHEEIMVSLKQRKDKAELIVNEFKELKNEYERKKAELEKKASNKHDWAFGLAFVPFVNLIASPLLLSSAGTDLANAVANGAEAKVQEAAAIIVSYTLIPALEGFIEGLSAAAGFFSVMEQELHKFEGKAERNLENPKKIHYIVMKKEAKDMKAICQSFYAVLPSVRTDFRVIQEAGGTDQNYVDRCLERQKKIIRETCTDKKVADSMLKAIAR